MIIGRSGSEKRNTLLNLIKKQNKRGAIDKICLYARDLNEPKYQFLIEKRGNIGIKHYNDLNTFIGFSNMMDDVYENIDDYNLSRKRKTIIVFQ